MSNPNYTHIVILADASGSMNSTRQATVDGINNFLESQKHGPTTTERNLCFEDDLSDHTGETKCTASVFFFNGDGRSGYATNGEPQDSFNYVKVFENQDINSFPPVTIAHYIPRGGTPLLDAFYKTITECSGFIHRLPENERPGRIMLVSYTDGEENDSKRRTRTELRALIEEKVKLNWQFIYIGANQDSFSEGASIGVAKGQMLNYVADDAGIARGFSCLADNVLQKRSVGVQFMSSACISDLDASTCKAGGTTINTALTNIPSNGLNIAGTTGSAAMSQRTNEIWAALKKADEESANHYKMI